MAALGAPHAISLVYKDDRVVEMLRLDTYLVVISAKFVRLFQHVQGRSLIEVARPARSPAPDTEGEFAGGTVMPGDENGVDDSNLGFAVYVRTVKLLR